MDALLEAMDQMLSEALKSTLHHKRFSGYGVVDRVRGGKTQFRVVRSERKGYKIKDGRLIRMSFAEQRKRRISARIAVRKRRAKQSQALRRRHISLRIRKSRFGAAR